MSEQWHWQKPGKAWHGVGIYHATLTVPSREPLLGELIIPENDPKLAYIKRSNLGERIVHAIFKITDYYPEVRVLLFCIMPDHVHIILHVQRTMPNGIMTVVRGFWQGAKKMAREQALSVFPNTIRGNQQSSDDGFLNAIQDNRQSQEDTQPIIFTEMPFVRPMSHRGHHLNTMIQYVKMNPQRLATKRLMPGFFRVQHNVELAGRKYDAIGNIKILQTEQPKHPQSARGGQAFAPVHVRSIWVEDAERHVDDSKLRDYKNGCIRAARKGTVMVSPFISPHEKAVLDYLLLEHHTIIYIADNGFGEYYKPAAALFDAVADGRMLILSPWQHNPDKKHVTRAECIAMNQMAEEICNI